jgi:hypothetical protein
MNETFYKVVEDLFRARTFKRLLGKYNFTKCADLNYLLREDLEQEIILMLLTYKNQDKLLELYLRGELQFWVSRMMSNQVNGPTTLFNIKYLRMLVADDIKEVMKYDDQQC